MAAATAMAGAAAVAAVSTGAAAQAAPAATGNVLAANTPNAVPGSYIVVLKDSSLSKSAGPVSEATAEVSSKAQGLASGVGAQVGQAYGAALKGFSLHGSEQAAKQLAGRSDVAYVQQSHTFRATDVASWGLDRVDQHSLPLDGKYTAPNKAENVNAFIIDTGVDKTHPTFGGRVQKGMDAVQPGGDGSKDGQGHGTHVAGTVGGAEFGLAPGVKITPVRVLDDQGSGSTEQVVNGINWAAQNAKGPSVANMSLGGPVDQALDDAVKGAIGKGITFAVAAGNESQDAGSSSPARVPEAITVAASDQKDGQADFSNFGKVVDLYAPGVGIVSAKPGGGTATHDGTSMASPHATGAAALWLSTHPDAKPDAVAKGLVDTATPDKIQKPTGGTPNKLLYVGK